MLTPACREIIRLKPKRVLDVGIGIGKWGVLVREYAEMWADHRFYANEWEVELTGVEIHERYENPAWGVYTRVFRGNCLDLVKTVDWAHSHFDLGIMIDVLEHIEKGAALEYLQWLTTKCKNVLLSYSNHEQKGVRDNPHEDHISTWRISDLPKPCRLLAGGEDWGLVLLGQEG